jgi:hypothetical protein
VADILKNQGSGENRAIIERYKDMGDGTFALVVSGAGDSGGGGDGGAERALLTMDYHAKNAFTGASIGDWIRSTQVLDLSGDDPVQVGSTIWTNETTGLALASAPLITDLQTTDAAGGLTNAQLRATAVAMSSVDLGTMTDTIATTDTGTFSLIALFKSLLSKTALLVGYGANEVTALNAINAKFPTLISAMINLAGVAVTSTVGAVVPTNASRKAIYFRNTGPGLIGIGPGVGTGAALTMLTATIVLGVGDLYIEDNAGAASLQWFGISDSTANLAITYRT